MGLNLWHRRRGFVAKDRVKKLASGIVEGMEILEKAQKIDCTLCV